MNALTPGSARLDLLVENVHCAGCIAKIERTVQAIPGVSEVRLNMGTHRLMAAFDPAKADPDEIQGAVVALGYPATPYRAQNVVDEGAGEERRLLLSLAVGGFAAGNVMLLSVSIWAGGDDMGEATRALFHWLSALIALPAVVFAGRPFFESAWRALSRRSMNMDVPISLGVILASCVSLFETFENGRHAYFDAAITLLFFLLIGRYLDHRARTQARSAAARLLSLSGDTARLLDADGRERSVAIAEILPGQVVVVAAGDRIPVDGVIIEGTSDVDASLLTGESIPRGVAVGERVFAGTVNLTGPMNIRVEAAASDTLLADIVRLMEAAEQGRSAYVKFVDRVARLYSPVVHILALLTFLAWWLGAGTGVREAVLAAVAVLIITCPCALGLAVPVVRVVAHSLLFARGVLVKSSDALERLAVVDTVVFDKTGTLTRGNPEIVDRPSDLVLAEAAALGRASRHPLSRAVVAAAHDLILPTASDIHEVAGAGVEATIGGKTVRLGRRNWAAPEERDDKHDDAELWLAASDGARHRLRFRDALKDDAISTIAALRDLGLHVMIVSGDRTAAVANVAHTLGIADWQSERRPDDKVAVLRKLAAEGRKVLMVGDGLNDAPALAAGFVSVSPAFAADISRAAADAVFQGSNLAPVLWLVQTARAAHARMRENVALAVIYNTVAVPIAMLGYVTPLIAAVAMSSSSILVTLNAIRLRRSLR